MSQTCQIENCDKLINRDNLCLRHKLLKVNVGTVPGGARDERTKISKGKEAEKGLHRYRELKRAGEQPSGTSLKAQREDSYKKYLYEKHERGLSDDNSPETMKQIKKNLTNT